jgi:carboxyvinyl-carboxyphosphonate phosphorylmutase
MINTDRRTKMRASLAGSGCAVMATVFDPVSARIAEDLAYEAALVGGSIMSHAVLGAPDVIVLTLTELAEQVHRCARVSKVPLLIDADHGYGNALSVMRTVQELDAAGAAAVMIEDTLLPRAFGPSGAAQLLSFDESVGKIRAAVAARGDSDLVVLGRTSAHAITGIEDAIARFSAYEAAGVDALFLPGLRTREELDRISAAVKLPLVVGGPADALLDEEYLASRRVRLWAAGHHTFAVAVNALYDAMKAVRAGTISSRLPHAASRELMDRVTGVADFDRWTRQFLDAS